MMTANLVGFVVGVDGARELWKVMLGGWEGASVTLPTLSTSRPDSLETHLAQAGSSCSSRVHVCLLQSKSCSNTGAPALRDGSAAVDSPCARREEERRRGISRKC